jgi:hypothetical protein
LFLQAPEPNLFRHNVACTAERDGTTWSFAPLNLKEIITDLFIFTRVPVLFECFHSQQAVGICKF